MKLYCRFLNKNIEKNKKYKDEYQSIIECYSIILSSKTKNIDYIQPLLIKHILNILILKTKILLKVKV